ncbi:MAG: DUF4365 domain-containing protein [Solirubrobacterales bacterium]|nr:DUF4365 domain-containing protein [Solirubrobacterales bacterium]
MENDHHDIGTDLVVWVRDARLFDLGLVVGVQVKGGESYFRSPKKSDDGTVEGWWYAEGDRSHFDAWASSSVPHLLVLHDLDTKTSYWAHITSDTIVSTGKGAKVLVPKANTVDKEHLSELLQVAAVNQTRPSWEGTTWSDAQSLAPGDQWRYAAIVPRLVAPHPNSFPDDPITAAEVFAMLVQCRFQELQHRLNKHSELPGLLEAEDHDEWDWRFVGSFAKYLNGDPATGLKLRVEEAPSDHRECVAVVTLACVYLNGDHPEHALGVLNELVEDDQSEPVDLAWLKIQRGRVRAELGQLTDARSDAFDTLAVGDQAAEDLTATALAGSAAALIFGTSSAEQMDVQEVVTAGDTIAGWWRSQELSGGLAHSAERTFNLWTRDESSVTFAAEDLASTKLLASSLAAGFAADHGGWRRAIGLMGTDALMRVGRQSDPVTAAQGIELLRISGDSKALKLANVRLLSDGPAEAVTIAASNVDPAKSTRTTSLANLQLLEQAGDVLSENIADRNVLWLRETLADPRAFIDRTTPFFLLDVKIAEAIAGLIPSCSQRVTETIAEDISRLNSCFDQLKAKSWARIAQQFPPDLWTDEQIESLKRTPTRTTSFFASQHLASWPTETMR